MFRIIRCCQEYALYQDNDLILTGQNLSAVKPGTEHWVMYSNQAFDNYYPLSWENINKSGLFRW